MPSKLFRSLYIALNCKLPAYFVMYCFPVNRFIEFVFHVQYCHDPHLCSLCFLCCLCTSCFPAAVPLVCYHGHSLDHTPLLTRYLVKLVCPCVYIVPVSHSFLAKYCMSVVTVILSVSWFIVCCSLVLVIPCLFPGFSCLLFVSALSFVWTAFV